MTAAARPEIPSITGTVFDRLTPDKIRERIITPPHVPINTKLYQGDHWLDNAGWIGPKPGGGDEDANFTWDLVKAMFTSRNVVMEGIERHVDAVLGKEPRWAFVPNRFLKPDEQPSETEANLARELEAKLTDWWDKRGVHEFLKSVMVTLMYAERSPARLYLPSGLLPESNVAPGARLVSAGKEEEALDLIYHDHPNPSAAALIVDHRTKRECGVVIYREDPDDAASPETVELSFLDAQRKMTMLRVISGTRDATYRYNFQKQLQLIELRRKSFITEQIRQQQKALNLAVTMVPHTVTTSGFLERVLLNAQMPGEWEMENGKRKRFKPAPYYTGSGTTNFVTGVNFTDKEGKTILANPSVNWREPSSVENPVAAAAFHYRGILDEMKQSHVLLTAEATPSGKSRVEARADFVASTRDTLAMANRLGRWVLQTTVAMMEQFIGTPGKYTGSLRPVFACRPDYGPLTPEERQQVIAEMEKNAISRQTAMAMLGIDDVDAELAAIMGQPGQQAALSGQIADTVVKWATVLGIQEALVRSGFTEQEAKEIVERNAKAVEESTTDPAVPDELDDEDDDPAEDPDA